MKKLFIIFLIFAVLINTQHLKAADGHRQALLGTILGGALIGVGAASLVKDIGTCSTPAMVNCWKIPLDLLEIAGGAMAMKQNNMAAKQTAPNSGPAFNPNIPTTPNTPNTPNTTTPNFPNTSDPQKPIVFGTDSNGNPNFQFPPKEELEKLVNAGFQNGTAPDGTTLEGALSKLNENYDKAKEAMDAYNQQALAGGQLPSSDFGSSPSHSQLADSNGGETSLDNAYLGLDKGSKLSSNDPYSGLDSSNYSGTNPLSANSSDLNLDKIKKERGESKPVKMIGLNAEDSSGRTLSIFERVSRAIRGDRHRDLTLAKIEWTRKAVLNKPKTPSILAPKVKLSAAENTKANETKTQI